MFTKFLLAFALALILPLFYIEERPAAADHTALFGYAEFNNVLKDLRIKGYHEWRYLQDASGVNDIDDWRIAYGEFSQRYNFDLYESPTGHEVYSSGGSEYVYGNSRHRGCAAWSIGCLPAYGSDAYIVVDSQRMAPWPQRSRVEVMLHEIAHQLADAAEGYQESYVYGATACGPLDDGGVAVIVPNHGDVVRGIRKSIMNCGLFNGQFLDQFVDAVWCLQHCTVNPTYMYDGGYYAYWCGMDHKTQAIAMGGYNPSTGEYRYIGHVPAEQWNVNGCGIAGTTAYLLPGERPCFDFANNLDWKSPWMRADVCLL